MMAKSLEDEGDEAEVIEAAGLDKAHVFWFPVKWRIGGMFICDIQPIGLS